MPVQQESFTSKSEHYPFEDFADGKIYLWLRDEDYASKDQSFAASARSWGQRNGYETSAHRVDKGVEVQFIKREAR